MENASKALLMGAGILIAMMVLSLAVYLFVTFSDYARGVSETNRENQTAQFNSQFTSYNEMTMYDVISLGNLAKDYNERNNFVETDDEYISIHLNIKGLDSMFKFNFEQNVSSFNVENYPELVSYIGYDQAGNQVQMFYKYEYESIEYSTLTQRVKVIQITSVD